MNISSLPHSLSILSSLSLHTLFILSVHTLSALSSLYLLSSSYKRVELCCDPSARQAPESRLELPGKDVHNDAAVAHEVLPPRLRRHTLQLPFILRITHVSQMLVRCLHQRDTTVLLAYVTRIPPFSLLSPATLRSDHVRRLPSTAAPSPC